MFAKIGVFTLLLPVKFSAVRNFHLSASYHLFWRKLRKITNEKLEIEKIKSSRNSEEVFELSEHKVNELKSQQQIESDAFIKKMIFEEAILIYLQRYGKTRRGHVEFINASLKKMKEFDVNKSLEMYKKILEIFPEVKMIPRTFWQTEMSHYPKQQECAIDILVAMEENGVIPDEDFCRMLYKRFGLHTSPMVRYQRMMYWMPKFKNANPWPVPQILPHDPSELGRLALMRMNPEKETVVTVHEVDINEYEKTWIASAQSHVQKKLISYLGQKSPRQSSDNDVEQRIAYIDGPFPVWLRNKCLTYYILNTEIDKSRLNHHHEFKEKQNDLDKVSFDNWYTIFDPNTKVPVHFGETKPDKVLARDLTIYEDDLDNRSILASCITGNDSLGSLRTWVNMVIRDNADLNGFKIVFRLTNRPADVVSL